MLASILAAFYNTNIGLVENFVIWLNCIGAIFAVYFNFKASAIGLPKFRLIHFLVGTFATIYVIGYLILLILDPSYLYWSSWFRGISLFIWVIVWILPARISIDTWHEWKVAKKKVEEMEV